MENLTDQQKQHILWVRSLLKKSAPVVFKMFAARKINSTKAINVQGLEATTHSSPTNTVGSEVIRDNTVGSTLTHSDSS